MDKKKTISIGGLILLSAIIWGAVILGCSWKLKGTECYDQIQNILSAGAGIHLIFILGPIGALFATMKKQREEEDK